MRAGTLSIVAPVLLLSACSKGADTAPAPPPPVTVVVETVRPAAAANVIDLPGRVAPVRTAEVRARVNGIVERRLYQEGSDVRAGQPLFRIDPLPLKAAALDQANAAQRRAAEATATNARQDADRFAPLVRENAISRQEYDAARSRLATAQADVRAAAAQAETARLSLGYATVTAPISGRAGRAQVTEGALASQTSATLLTTIDQLDPIYVNFSQSNADLLALRRAIASGAVKSGGLAAARVRLVLEDGTVYPMAGRLNFLDLAVDPTTGSVSLRAEFPNPRRTLLPGAYVRARVEAGVTTSALTVPQASVVLKPEGSSVLVVGAGSRVASRPVTLGPMTGQRWTVLSGIAAGDRVVVTGIQKARPGAVVRVAAAAAPAAAP